MGVWQMNESPEVLLAMLERKEDYLPFLETLHTDKRKQEWLASRVLLKELLGREARIAYRTTGAPYLPDVSLSISISHTKGYVAVLLSHQPAAGIDIEHRSDRILKIRSRFLAPDEERNVINQTYEVECLLVCWCAKETLFKLIGQENVDFCRHLHVLPFTYSPLGGNFTATESRTSLGTSFVLQYLVTPWFVLTYSE